VNHVDDIEPLRQAFGELADSMGSRAPLWSSVCRHLATDPAAHDLIAILRHAPADQRRPVLLMAALHDVLLGTATELPDNPWPVVLEMARRHEERLVELVSTRHTQTNEVGRCAPIMAALSMLTGEVGALSLVEFGSSAGLLLHLDRYDYRYDRDDGEATTVTAQPGRPSAVELRCGVRGHVPVPQHLPNIESRVGVDTRPIDVHDTSATRWLEACVWPDQLDRLSLLRAALAIAREHQVTIIRDDAVVRAPHEVRQARAHPVVVSSWALTYAPAHRRRELLNELDALSERRDLSMVLFEDPAMIEGIPVPTRSQDRNRTVLAVMRWRSGQRSVERLGTTHPHGFWWHGDT
jgi:hypothetical protein